MFFGSALLAALLLTNLSEVASAIQRNDLGRFFTVRGQVLLTSTQETPTFIMANSELGLSLRDMTGMAGRHSHAAGDFLKVSGRIESDSFGLTCAMCRKTTLVAKGVLPEPVTVTGAKLLSGTLDCRRVRLHGIVRETFRDEIDPRWIYLSLSCGSELVSVVFCDNKSRSDNLKSLVDAEVTVDGVCLTNDIGLRLFNQNKVMIPNLGSIKILKAPPKDPFSLPQLDLQRKYTQSEILTLGKRRLSGRVIAIWQNNTLLLEDDSHSARKVKLRYQTPPHFGDRIEIVGFPETDLYRINLADALWRKAGDADSSLPSAVKSSASEILTDSFGNARINPNFHGKTISLTGLIQDLPTIHSGQGVLTLKSDGFTIPVDISANPSVLYSLSVGCTVSIAGTCVVETESWRPFSSFPRAKGILLVVRAPEDIVILSRPPWWTPQRLMIVVGVLLLVIVIIFIWNRILQRVIDRKSRQLLKEQVAQIKSELRVNERTHLAVELHDTLSQNLSGVACQIAATKGTLPEGADKTARYLETAERMLLSCRTELRRCLWDLRGDTLEESNFTEAIRKTLAPIVIGAETIIRFNVSRSRLSDTTAHAVLCIIRELAANAIRHGKARTLRIAGESHDGVLSFSVRDDGRGFDPSNCNGPAEGHFGLEGIRERIKHLDGTFTITSEIGRGSRAEVTLTVIQPKDNDLRT